MIVGRCALLAGIAVLFLATGTAHAETVMLKLQKESGEIFMTIMDIREKCPDETQPRLRDGRSVRMISQFNRAANRSKLSCVSTTPCAS
jgi:hypothetical protein